jgi:uncharacterized protein YqhQ
MAKSFHYGGQAVIEGVMIRGKEGIAICVRQPNGELNILRQPLAKIYRGRLRETPLIRGIFVLIETLILGTQALLHSAEVASESGEEKMPRGILWGTVAVSVVFGVALFFAVPLFATRYLIDPFIGSALISNVIEGFIRIGIFVAYLKLIGLVPDIKRVFAYHGAEHKVVNAYEAGAPLQLDSARRFPTTHARCGTAFIFIVLIVAIFIFAILGRPALWVSVLSRVLLIPVIAIIGYEIVRFTANHSQNRVVKLLFAPGLLLQAMTTREPDDSQIETAISALNQVLDIDSNANLLGKM